jgi:hypothetical protein
VSRASGGAAVRYFLAALTVNQVRRAHRLDAGAFGPLHSPGI